MKFKTLYKVSVLKGRIKKINPVLAGARTDKQLLRIVKLNMIILLTCLGVSAGAYAQGITLSGEKASLEKILVQIQEQTDYTFIYTVDVIQKAKPVNISLKEGTLEQALAICFKDQPLTYTIIDRVIVVKEKETGAEDSQTAVTISGKVTDEDGLPLPGATVLIKGTYKGITTDKDGNYAIKVPGSQTTLVFSFVGFKSQEITVGVQTTIDVILEQSTTELEEVTINAGYYTVTEKTKTGNISKISAKEIEQQPVNNPIQALQGRVPGVSVVELSGLPGSPQFIEIRGRNSLRFLGNDPLYIVDGVPFPSQSINTNRINRANAASSPLSVINLYDIESIEILKDADATAIYGSRGANGVILITTKKGRVGETKVDISVYTGFGEVAKRMDLLNTEQYLEMRKEAMANDGLDPIPPGWERFFPDVALWDQDRYTDWQEELISGKAMMTNANISISGGSPYTSFLLSGNYTEQGFVYPGNFKYQKGSGHFNLNHRSKNDKITLALTTTFSIDKNKQPTIDFMREAVTLPPNAPPIYDEKGDLNWENGTWANPFARLEEKVEAVTKNLLTNATLKYRPVPELEIKSDFGYSFLQTNEVNLLPLTSFNPLQGRTSGVSYYASSDMNTWSIEPQLNYRKKIGKGKLDAIVGASFQESITKIKQIGATGFASDALLENLASGSLQIIGVTDYNKYRYNAFFTRINYNWDGKYIINLTGRRDGSSRFGPGKQFANFGAIGAAWVFSDENFSKDLLPFLSFGKLRTSFGITGSDQIGNYEYLDTYTSTFYSYQDNPSLIPSRLFNADFAWESVKKFEIALALGFIKDRISLEVSYYNHRTSNQLVGSPLSLVTGFPSIQANFPAVVENRGWELVLSTVNIKTKDFEWITDFNLTIPHNEIIEFPDIENTSYYPRLEVGRSLYTVFGPVYTGVNPETGLYNFEDSDNSGNPLYNPNYPGDYTYLGEISRKYYGGLNNSFKYKGFQLDFLFEFVKQTTRDPLQGLGWPGSMTNQPVVVMDRWRKNGDVAAYQRFSIFGEASTAYFAKNNSTIVDASYICLTNLSLSYQFSSQWLKKLKIKKLNVFVQGQHLFTISDYLGFSPGRNLQTLPPLRTITAGINLTL